MEIERYIQSPALSKPKDLVGKHTDSFAPPIHSLNIIQPWKSIAEQ